MSPGIQADLQESAFQKLTDSLESYVKASGKTTQQVLVEKGKQLAVASPTRTSLYHLFRQQSPIKGEILSSIQANGWRLGRKNQSGQANGISDTAWQRAKNLMGGYKSILAAVTETGGRISLRGVRIGTKGRRIGGGRRGLNGVPVNGADRNFDRRPGEVTLNFRAVATAMEVNLRESGRRFEAASWLFRKWFKGSSEAASFTRNVQVVQPRSHTIPGGQLGSAELLGVPDAGSGQQGVLLRGNVPGTQSIGKTRGLFTLALNAVTADMAPYLKRKQEEALRKQLQEVS